MSVETNRNAISSPWILHEDLTKVENHRLSETLFSQGNGFIGVRGTPEEGWSQSVQNEPLLSCEGIYLNGCYSKAPIPYGESAYAFATHNDQLLQVPNTKAIHTHVHDELKVLAHFRTLDMHTGVLTRRKVVETQTGAQCVLNFERFVSDTHPHLLCLQVRVSALKGPVEVSLIPKSDDQYGSVSEPDDPRAGELSIVDTLTLLESEFSDNFSHFLYHIEGVDEKVSVTCIDELKQGEKAFNTQLERATNHHLEEGESLCFTRFSMFHAGSDTAALVAQRQASVSKLKRFTYESLKAEHVSALNAFWQQAELGVELQSGNTELQQGLIFSVFQLYQSAGRNGVSAIAAKGLSGPGYDGHYFWDTEIYVIPFFALTSPHIAKSLLLYRYHTLAQAKQRAKQMSHNEGALFAWRTISGEECSAFFPASTAQYHINAAVAFAIRTYFRATGDAAFMREYGIELLVETARLWPQLGHFNDAGDFCIDGVTGPDEYTAVVNNNFYTNYMAKQHLLFTIEAIALLDESKVIALGVNRNTLDLWQRIADKMYLPFDEKRQAHPQDDSFFQKKVWDLSQQPQEKMPLLLHYHPLVIYRHQVLKQADVILAMFLGDDDFSLAQKKGNLAYYAPLTTHDSTLSSCIHSILYAEVGEMEQAVAFFGDSARMDLDNLHHNTEYGVHTACMAGAWSCVVFGFLGLRLKSSGLSLKPVLPKGWQSIRQKIQFQGACIDIHLQANTLTLCQLGSQHTINLTCQVNNHTHQICLSDSESQVIDLASTGVEPCN